MILVQLTLLLLFDAQSSAADTAVTGDNADIEAAADAIIDFTEGNPFGSL